MAQKPITRDAICKALKQHGPMIAADIARIINKSPNAVVVCIRNSINNHGSEFVYVHQDGFCPVYAAGPIGAGHEKAKPKPEPVVRKPAHPFSGLGDL